MPCGSILERKGYISEKEVWRSQLVVEENLDVEKVVVVKSVLKQSVNGETGC